MNICRMTITGNIGRIEGLRYTPSGKAVLDLSVASTVGFGDNKRTEWTTCVVWGNFAEAVANNAKVGDFAVVEGRKQTDEWEKDGQKRSKVTCVVDTMEWKTVERKQQNSNQSQSGGGFNDPPFNPDDDVPFAMLPHWKEFKS